MARLPRMVAGASVLALALPLANCTDLTKFDPSDMLDNIMPDQKKPLPGERKPLFPEGTPGVPQGVPPDLVKGYQPPPEGTDASQQTATPGSAQGAPPDSVKAFRPPPEAPDDSQQPAPPAQPKAKSKAKATAAAPAASPPPPAPHPNRFGGWPIANGDREPTTFAVRHSPFATRLSAFAIRSFHVLHGRDCRTA